MKLVGLMAARNEDWVIGLSARAALMWCDELIILNHASTDGTSDIIAEVVREHPDRVTPVVWEDPVWQEMAQRQHMLDVARFRKATHLAYVDADEVLTGNLIDWVRPSIEKFLTSRQILELPWLCLRGSIHKCHVSGVWGDQHASMVFEDSPELHWVARDGYDFHHRAPMGKDLRFYRPVVRTLGGLMHLQFVNDRRLRAKQALYKMTEVIRWPGRSSLAEINTMYDRAVYYNKPEEPMDWPKRGEVVSPERAVALMRSRTRSEPADLLATVPDLWWGAYSHLMRHLQPDTPAWQELECIELMKEYGPRKFEGLDLYGVCG